MDHLNRGNVFRLNHSSGKNYIGFVKGGRDLLTLVLFDHESNTLKTLTGFSAGNKNVTKLTKEDMPDILKKHTMNASLALKKAPKLPSHSMALNTLGWWLKVGLIQRLRFLSMAINSIPVALLFCLLSFNKPI